MTCSSSIALERHVSLLDGSMAIAYDFASCFATKSVRAIGSFDFRRGTRVLPAYGSIEMRPMIHASASNVAAVRSYSRVPFGPSSQFFVTIRPSIDGSMWQITYGRFMRLTPPDARRG